MKKFILAFTLLISSIYLHAFSCECDDLFMDLEEFLQENYEIYADRTSYPCIKSNEDMYFYCLGKEEAFIEIIHYLEHKKTLHFKQNDK